MYNLLSAIVTSCNSKFHTASKSLMGKKAKLQPSPPGSTSSAIRQGKTDTILIKIAAKPGAKVTAITSFSEVSYQVHEILIYMCICFC